MGRHHAHAVKVGNGRRRPRRATIHQSGQRKHKAVIHEEGPRALTPGPSAIQPVHPTGDASAHFTADT